MLKYLHIENIAVIESTEIEFSDGFNVLTGETGAGKSIVIDAINAVLGERTSRDLIRAGCDTASVSALFGDLNTNTLKTLAEYDIEPDEDGNLLIVRKLSLTGKGMIKINGKPFTATALREIAGALINIHGQHDNQALLNPESHIGYIDALSGNTAELENYYSEFKNINRIRKELQSLECDEDEKQRKTELLKYQIKELTEADIKTGEIAELKERLAVAENYEKTVKALSIAKGCFFGGDDSDGAILQLKNAQKQLDALSANEIDKNRTKLIEAISILDDVAEEVSKLLETYEFSDFNPDDINQRLDYLYRLMLKYGNSEEKMLEFLDKAQKELESITFSDKRVLELSDELEVSKRRLIDLGAVLTETRKKTALEFENNVGGILEYLNMPSVTFKVDIESGRYTKKGCDAVEFMISSNKGESVKPLHKIASGGELSRTMLAIKSVLLDKDTVGTMIFDEIDTGISGYAADRVGEQLCKVAQGRQVICVTHLAQIAARADCHLLIEKNSDNDRTYTKVYPLKGDSRIGEIARIMSGSSLTENLYNSAKELIDRSQKK